ncbi:MAG: hypothetical protein Q8M92_01365, partial [Candidatus Subteraquimicrobiales bacterium]|nr:hypothetical protein [Candidatus Subteraquimicrobiales bacterium]
NIAFDNEKRASWGQVAKWLGPAAGMYMLGGHVINKAKAGHSISAPERFVAQKPMAAAIGATLLINKPRPIMRGIKAIFKKAELGMDMSQINIDELPLEERDLGGIAVWEIVNNII